MLSRSKLLEILRNSLRGDLFEKNFSLIVAAISLLSALADCSWPQAVLDEGQYVHMLANLLSLLPSTAEEVRHNVCGSQGILHAKSLSVA